MPSWAVTHFSVSTWQQPVPLPASPGRTALPDDLAAQVDRLSNARTRVAIDGRTAAGKTSFDHELAGALDRLGRPVLRATLDDFKRPWRDRHRYDRESAEGYYRNAFDLDRVNRLLLDPAAPDGTGSCVLCSIDPNTQVDHADVVTTMPDDAIMIVDGVFAFRPELNDAWDLRIWLEVDPGLSLRRGIERDGPDTEHLHRERYRGSEELYLAESDPLARADVVIDNTDLANPNARWRRTGP
ncbi:MAG: uridine kinase [Actinomycetota bacterium]|nr:uridine kinase [Actinomycetota bacterium]